MPLIKFVHDDGRRQDVEVEAGHSVMEGARDNDVEGIVAECGGCLACATCHVYVDAEWFHQLPEQSSMEVELLDGLINRRSNSRLSCQLIVMPELEGLPVHVPTDQS